MMLLDKIQPTIDLISCIVIDRSYSFTIIFRKLYKIWGTDGLMFMRDEPEELRRLKSLIQLDGSGDYEYLENCLNQFVEDLQRLDNDGFIKAIKEVEKT